MLMTDDLEALRAERDITLRTYRKGVSTLVAFIRANDRWCGATGPIKRILLTAYNPAAWSMSAADLLPLDDDNLEAALAVLRGRAVTSREPHRMIDGGEAFFRALAQEALEDSQAT